MAAGASSAADVERALWALRAYDTGALATTGQAGPHVTGVFLVPEAEGPRLWLTCALLTGSRAVENIGADPRVAILCSPGNPSRWIQATGTASAPDLSEAERLHAFRRLTAHAPGAARFIDRGDARPVLIELDWLRVIEASGAGPLELRLG